MSVFVRDTISCARHRAHGIRKLRQNVGKAWAKRGQPMLLLVENWSKYGQNKVKECLKNGPRERSRKAKANVWPYFEKQGEAKKILGCFSQDQSTCERLTVSRCPLQSPLTAKSPRRSHLGKRTYVCAILATGLGSQAPRISTNRS